MHQKGLERLSSEPQLLVFYKHATEAVYKVQVRVGKEKHVKFRDKEKELAELGILPRDYAYGVAVLLEKWVTSKKMRNIPVNVFLGPWALKKFRKVNDSITVTISDFHSDDDVSVLWSEIIVAKYYVEANLIKHTRLSKVVAELEPLLSEKWLEMYEQGTRLAVETQVLMQLEEEYMVRGANSYTDIVDKLVLNGHS